MLTAHEIKEHGAEPYAGPLEIRDARGNPGVRAEVGHRVYTVNTGAPTVHGRIVSLHWFDGETGAVLEDGFFYPADCLAEEWP